MNKKRYITNFLEYIIALGVAVLIYLFFTLNQNIEENNFIIPLIAKFDSNFISLNTIPQSVQIVVKGNPSSLNKIVEQNMTAIVDFSSVKKAGMSYAPVVLQRSGSFAQIHNVEVTIFPAEVQTQFDKKISKNLKVRPAFINSLPRGYTFEYSKVSPQVVRVFGPRSMLNDIDFIATNAIDLSNVTKNISMDIALQSPTTLIEFADAINIKVSIVVRQSTVVRVFKNVVPKIKNLSPQLAFNRKIVPVVLTVQGPLLFLDEYEPFAFIDCYQYKIPGVYEAKIAMNAVEGVQIVSLKPNVVFIELRSITQHQVPSLDPRIQRQNNSSSNSN